MSSLENPTLLAGVAVAVAVVAASVFFFLKKGGNKGSSSNDEDTGLHQRDYRKFPLIEKKQISPNTYFFRFGLQTPNTRLGLPVGKHMVLRYMAGEDPVSRPYTPVSSDDDLGHFDLVIKLYDKGKMSQHLAGLVPNKDVIEARGPLGALTYAGKGAFEIKRKNPETSETENYKRKVKNIGMLAGGTGITPMLQIINDASKRKESVKISLIFGNITEDDILCRQELKDAVEENKNVSVYYTLDKPPAGWTGGAGYVTEAMIKQHLPPPSDDTIILLCGPPPMIAALEKTLLKIGYTEDMFFKY